MQYESVSVPGSTARLDTILSNVYFSFVFAGRSDTMAYFASAYSCPGTGEFAVLIVASASPRNLYWAVCLPVFRNAVAEAAQYWRRRGFR